MSTVIATQAVAKPNPMANLDELVEQYGRVPAEHFRYCPGCGLGMAQSALMRAFQRLQIDMSQVAGAGGSGCYSIMGHYLNMGVLHGGHGRGAAMATGMKLANPHLTVVNLQGDGDSLSIGGNHTIHAARRNIDVTVVMFNNFGYGDTGGQYGATTPKGSFTETSPYGMPEEPFDACKLMIGAGATFVARSTVYHAVHLTKVLAEAIAWKGFSFVEVMQHCHVLWGKRNGMPKATDMLNYYRDNSVFSTPNLKREEQEGKFVLGVLHKQARPEFTEEYAKIRKLAAARAGGQGLSPLNTGGAV